MSVVAFATVAPTGAAVVEAYWEIAVDGQVDKEAKEGWVVTGASHAKEEYRVKEVGRRSGSTLKKASVLLKVVGDDCNIVCDVRKGCRASDGVWRARLGFLLLLLWLRMAVEPLTVIVSRGEEGGSVTVSFKEGGILSPRFYFLLHSLLLGYRG